MHNKYIILTSAFNEEQHIERTIQSVIKQTIKPIEWIIIDDGSTDGTADIVKQYTDANSWIKLFTVDKGTAEFGTHAVINFYKGFEKIQNNQWSLIVKLDADLDIDRSDFFEIQIDRFNTRKDLGISSGITYSEHTGKKVLTKGRPYWRTGGAMKVYRRQCFDQIGGLKPLFGWDGLDEYQAMYYGWKTRTFFDLEVNHLGKIRALSRENQKNLSFAIGQSLYSRGYPVEFIIIKLIKVLVTKGKGHATMLYNGYFAKQNKRKIISKQEERFIRKIQYLRLIDKFTKKQLL
jgi:glycosyltransferase involved in cell wall biosynthesis